MVKREHNFKIVGLQIFHLKLSSSMCFSLCSDAIYQGAGFEISANCDGEVHNGVVEFICCIIAVGLLLLVLLPVIFLLKKYVPGGECILTQVSEVREGMPFFTMIVLICLPGMLFRGAMLKWGLRYFPFCKKSLIAMMNSLGLSSGVRQMAASKKVRGQEYTRSVGVMLNPFVVNWFISFFWGESQDRPSAAVIVSLS
jgi:hypothetical protein